MNDLLPLLVGSLIRLAQRQCNAQDCGAERKAPGSRSKPLRCQDCPLDDVDALANLAFDAEAIR